MKKVITAIMLAISIVLTAMLSSCQFIPEEILDMIGLGEATPDDGGEDIDLDGEPENADELYERVTHVLKSVNSYEADVAMIMTLYFSGIKVESSATGSIIISEDYEGDAYYYSKIYESVKTADQEFSQTINILNAYYDGKAFVKNKGANVDQKFYSDCDAETYVEKYFGDNGYSILDEDYEACTSKEFSKTEDGWKIECSGYTASAVNDLTKTLGFDDLGIEEDINDLSVLIRVGEDYLPTEISVAVEFDAKDTSPMLEYTEKYSNYNNATPLTNEIDYTTYKEVPSIFLLEEIGDMLDDRANAKQGAFTLDITTDVYMMGSTVSSSREHDVVEYGTDDYGFYFTIDTTVGTQSASFSYKNGILTGGGVNQPQSQKDARASIEKLIDVAMYSMSDVSGIKMISETEFEFSLDASNNQSYRQIASSAGLHFDSAEEKIVYKIVDGVITDIDSEVIIRAWYVSGNSSYQTKITVSSSLSFDEGSLPSEGVI